MEISITSDYVKDTGNPSRYLKRIADNGFTHIHWCHHWNTDFLYSKWEIEQIKKWLTEFRLKLLDLHGSMGQEKNWASEEEYERLAGVELVKNRLEMASRLGSDVIIMHVPEWSECDPVRRSLNELEKYAKEQGVRIALENGNFEAVGNLLAEYDQTYLGLCYDSGHGNLEENGLEQLLTLKSRLISVHLHDNDGSGDQHNLPFTGTVNWSQLAHIIAKSSYSKCPSLEVVIRNSGIDDDAKFLKRAYACGIQISKMITNARENAT